MITIGLTGGIGSGKSFVADEFRALGATVVDADVEAREVVKPGQPALEEIRQHFGNAILQRDGTLDRARLRQRIFSQPEEKQWLEALLHPLIRRRIVQQLEAPTDAYHILVSPLLVETGQTELVQKVVVVDVDEATQLLRASQRDQTEMDNVRKIMASQLPRARRLASADYIIDNSGSRAATRAQVEDLHRTLLKISA